jgi:hypothetical protein
MQRAHRMLTNARCASPGALLEHKNKKPDVPGQEEERKVEEHGEMRAELVLWKWCQP